jgi:hypothetical protein
VATSAIRDAIQLCSQVVRRIGQLLPSNPNLSGRFIPAMIPGDTPVSPLHISPKNPVTAPISMKTIIKLRMPFFHSCTIELGALYLPESTASGNTPSWLLNYSCARLWRPRLVMPFAAPRIFDNCIKTLVGRAHSLAHSLPALYMHTIRRRPPTRWFTRTTPFPSSQLCYKFANQPVNLGMYGPIHRTRFRPQKGQSSKRT